MSLSSSWKVLKITCSDSRAIRMYLYTQILWYLYFYPIATSTSLYLIQYLHACPDINSGAFWTMFGQGQRNGGGGEAVGSSPPPPTVETGGGAPVGSSPPLPPTLETGGWAPSYYDMPILQHYCDIISSVIIISVRKGVLNEKLLLNQPKKAARNASQISKNFWGSMPPDPPRRAVSLCPQHNCGYRLTVQ